MRVPSNIDTVKTSAVLVYVDQSDPIMGAFNYTSNQVRTDVAPVFVPDQMLSTNGSGVLIPKNASGTDRARYILVQLGPPTNTNQNRAGDVVYLRLGDVNTYADDFDLPIIRGQQYVLTRGGNTHVALKWWNTMGENVTGVNTSLVYISPLEE